MKNEFLKNCVICPRKCAVNRYERMGFCKSSDKIKINTYQLHHWEEPVISGTQGSGTIFFSHCNLQCVFCQNYKISFSGYGKEFSNEEACAIMLDLQNRNAHNINLVSPTHYTPQLAETLVMAKASGLKIPVVWNTNGYEEVESLKLLEGLVDIYMPDFKYLNSGISRKYSDAADYPAKAKAAIKEMARQVGHLKVDNGLAWKGLLIRILVMPNDLNNTTDTLIWIAENLGIKTYISLMGQYYPTNMTAKYVEINRAITLEEYGIARNQLEILGFENGFLQGVGSSSEYTPDFESS